MYTVLVVLHIFVSVFLILVVLLQTGRGSDIGAVFGGGASQTLFGSAGPGTFLGKMTAVVAAIFMLTSLTMATRIFVRTPPSILQEPAPQTSQEAPEVPQKAPSQAPATPDKEPEGR